ncbi:MAG: hypothetical protein AAF317_15650 [Pseudomonadota bacterium]
MTNKESLMKKSRSGEGLITVLLQQAESGAPVSRRLVECVASSGLAADFVGT